MFLLSSSALMLLCSAGIAPSQTSATPPETPPATTTPQSPPAATTPQTPPAETPAPQTQQPAQPETPSTGEPPAISVPQVTVEAPKPRPARRAPPATPARTAAPRPPAPPAQPTPTPPTTPTTTTAGQPAATSLQGPPSLNIITTNQIQGSTAQSFGNLFFTMPGATSAGLAPGASRPVLRGLDDFRVRIQENGIGSMDLSDLGQDHGVPLDPLSVQKIEILRGPEALRPTGIRRCGPISWPIAGASFSAPMIQCWPNTSSP